MAHLAVLIIFVICVNDEISLVGWKYYSKATIGICGEHQTNLGALTTNGLIMLVFLIYKFRISYFQPLYLIYNFRICYLQLWMPSPPMRCDYAPFFFAKAKMFLKFLKCVRVRVGVGWGCVC